MFARFVFFLIALFWATMNVLLWRAEYGGGNPAGSVVPVDVVWRKILTAPDSSSLSIFQRGKKIGFCHWVTGVGEEFSQLEEAPPAGMTGKTSGHRIKLDGNVTVGDFATRARGEGSLKLDADRNWEELSLRLSVRPMVWEVRAVAAEQSVRFRTEDGEARTERVFRLADLQNPDALLREFAGPLGAALVNAAGWPAVPQNPAGWGLAVKWEARYDTLMIGHEPVRVYRLDTRLLDRYRIRIFVSRAGEILRAELPNGIVLMHDQLANS
jgi:hypothetical protein